jgi:hypothetical protein
LAEEGAPGEIASAARFHVTPDGRLFVFCHVSGAGEGEPSVSENRVMELYPDGTVSPAVRVPLQRTMTSFFTATVRGGSPPSNLLDLLGHTAGRPDTISYARVRIW